MGLLDAYDWLARQRGAGAPLAARVNRAAGNVMGPHLRKGMKPLADTYGLLSMGADIKDMSDFSASSAHNFQQGNFGGGLLDLAYAGVAPLGVILPGSVGMYRKGAEEVADGLLGMVDDVDPSMPRRLMPNEMKVYQGGPNLYGPDVPGTKAGLDSSKIGTGEGAQVYGHGHYLAENPATGRAYQEALGGRTRDGVRLNWDNPDEVASFRLNQFGGDKDAAIKWVDDMKPNPKVSKDNARAAAFGDEVIDSIRNGRTSPVDPGHLYEYDIPDETIAKMLDWDKPLSEQTPEALDALGFSRRTEKEINDEALRFMEEGNALSGRPGGWLDIPETKARIDSLNDELNRVPPADVSGESYYRSGGQGGAFDIMSKIGAGSDPQVLSRQLRESGIPGIRYLDQGSRAGGEGTSNFVLFDDDAAKLLARDDTRFDLPTDEASRMARAQEMGFDVETPMFHGTSADITSFAPSMGGSATGAKTGKMAIWLTDDPVTAKGYARHAATNAPVKKILREANEAADKGNWDLHEKKIAEAEILEKQIGEEGGLRGQNILPLYAPKDDEFRSIWDKAGELPSGLFVKNMKGRSFDDFGVSDEIQQILIGAKRDGHKGVKFENLDDAPGLYNRPATHVAIFDPKNIRSTNAQFDPAKKDSANILAGVGGLLATGAVAKGVTDDRKKNQGLLY